ncbi:MAG: hypothetical protein JW725_05120, partial [Candidatus Babeliaceae bacterium]|nr:hypothetical protein [Candidatus Babeliaceae bacterium]
TEQIGYVLDRISTRIGKGRFAQRLAPRVTKVQCPPYIEDCIRYIETLATPSDRTGKDEGEQGDSDELPF